jgi:inhibitor of cysteine peptidase
MISLLFGRSQMHGRILQILALPAVLALGCASIPPLRVGTSDGGRTIELKPGQELILQLDSNRTTGYSWSLSEAASSILEPVGEPVYASDTASAGRVGSGGTETWRFRAKEPGRQDLSLEYRRPWEQGVPPVRIVRFNVVVR